MSKPKMVCVRVYNISIDFEGSLQDVKEEMDRLQKVYGDRFERLHLEYEMEDYGDQYRYYLYGYRPQTEAEIKAEQDRQARYEAFEKQQYEKLKEKFG